MEIQNTPPTPQRLLVIRRNHMGDMICTLPLLYALRRRFPESHITVACDRNGAPIARACPAVNRVHVLTRGWLSLAANVLHLRGYDAAIAVKGGFDRRLGILTRLTDTPIRIGFHHAAGQRPSKLYSHPIPLPPAQEHQVDTCLRLLAPLGVTDLTHDFTLRLPDETTTYALETINRHRLPQHRFVAVVNVSSNRPLPLTEKQFATLIHRLAEELHALVAISCLPSESERAKAQHLIRAAKTKSAFVLETPSPLHLAAVLGQSGLVVTPEGGVGHLAATMGTPGVILWSEGSFEKWHMLAKNHRFVRMDKAEVKPSLNEIWNTVLETMKGPA